MHRVAHHSHLTLTQAHPYTRPSGLGRYIFPLMDPASSFLPGLAGVGRIGNFTGALFLGLGEEGWRRGVHCFQCPRR